MFFNEKYSSVYLTILIPTYQRHFFNHVARQIGLHYSLKIGLWLMQCPRYEGVHVKIMSFSFSISSVKALQVVMVLGHVLGVCYAWTCRGS